MRILHVITSLYTGGAEKLMVDLLPRLKQKGLDVELLLFDGTVTPFRKQLESSGIKIHDLGHGGSVYSPLRLFRLIPFLRRYDIIHTHNTAPQLFAAIGSLLSGVTLCTTEHSTSNRRRAWKWYAIVDKWMYGKYKSIICISDKAEENLRNYIGCSDDKICTINNGVDIEKYKTATASAKLDQIAHGSKKLIMVAAFRWEKDQDTIIRALLHLPEQFHLFLVGEGSRRDELEALVKEHRLEERIHFMGLRSDVPNLLHAADYILMSSHFEGLSLSSVEGMCAGKPFLASDVDGLHDVVNGAGVLFKHGDEKDLVHKILEIEANEDLYKEISDRCLLRANKFDIASMAEGYLEVYENLLG